MTVTDAIERFGENDTGLEFWNAIKGAGFVPIAGAQPKLQYLRPDRLGPYPVWPEGWCELLDGRVAFHSYYGGTYAKGSL